MIQISKRENFVQPAKREMQNGGKTPVKARERGLFDRFLMGAKQVKMYKNIKKCHKYTQTSKITNFYFVGVTQKSIKKSPSTVSRGGKGVC